MKVGFISVNLLVLAGFLAVSIPAIGEYYRYVDENGNISYTDDVSRIPSGQRTDTLEYKGYQSEMNSSQEVTGKSAEAAKEPEKITVSEGKNIPEGTPVNNENLSLDQRKKDLDKEFQALSDERKQLEDNRQTQKTKTDVKQNNEKINSMNKRIEEFKQRQEAFNTEATAHNAKMAEEAALKKAEKEKEAAPAPSTPSLTPAE